MIRGLSELYIENCIQQAFQGCALGIPLNPYQGLKLAAGLSTDGAVALGIPLNPYQGLKRLMFPPTDWIYLLGIPLNPYQGLKHANFGRAKVDRVAWNSLKSLSGIETQCCQL